jgi:hypothetical protein
MLDGDPGMVKSLLALDLCARLSTARVYHPPPLQALGADLERALRPPLGDGRRRHTKRISIFFAAQLSNARRTSRKEG